MDDIAHSSKCYNNKPSLKLEKDTKNDDSWLVNQCHSSIYTNDNRKSLKRVEEVPKEKPSLKVSLPIRIWHTMQEKRNSELMTTSKQSNQTVAHRLPPPPVQRFPGPLASELRMFRHPVPTTKRHPSLAEKYDQIVKTPKPIPPKTSFKAAISVPIMPGDVPSSTKEPANDPEKNKTEESNIAYKSNTPTEPCFLLTNGFESPLPIKHKLPFTVVPRKGSYSKKTINPINKENSTQATTEQVTQTETCSIVTDEEIHILEMVKHSGLTSEELHNRLENGKKEKEETNKGLVIDLESNDEENVNDMYAKVMKHSTNNKFVLNKIVKMLQENKDLISQPSTPPPKTPAYLPSASSVVQQTPLAAAGVTADTFRSPGHLQNSFEANDIQNFFDISAELQQMGFRIVRVEPQSQSTKTEETRNIKKRRLSTATVDIQTANELGPYEQNRQRPPMVPIRPSQEMPAHLPEMQEMAVLSTNLPRPSLQRQPYGPEHIERQALERQAMLYPNMSGIMPQQRAQNVSSRNHYNMSSVVAHNPFEHNRSNTTFSTPQTVQMPAPAQVHPNDPRRQDIHGQMPNSGHPHLSRILSTNEANMHGSQAQQPYWGYQHYYDRQGNVYAQRHQ